MNIEGHDDDTEIGVEDDELSPSDRRMLRAMATADSAHTGVVVLRVVAAVVSVSAVVGYALTVMEYERDDSGFMDGLSLGVPDRQQLAIFFASVSTPLAFAGLIFAASYLLAVYASRLDMDIVLADDEADSTPD